MFAGALVQVTTGAGLSVVCGACLIVVLGVHAAVPLLLLLNLLVSVVATAGGARAVAWRDVGLVALASTLGSAVAVPMLPYISADALKLVTAAVLLLIALRRPSRGGTAGWRGTWLVGIAGLASGMLTAWTATPGPVVPIGMAYAGRGGETIRRAMQPISIWGYGCALALLGAPPTLHALALPEMVPFGLATLAGSLLGLPARHLVPADRVAPAVRVIAALAAVTLIASAFLTA